MHKVFDTSGRSSLRFPVSSLVLSSSLLATSLSYGFAAPVAEPTVPARLEIGATELGKPISPLLYGIFFEEINHAGDGGIYAELVRNRSFENDAKTPAGWIAAEGAQIGLDTTRPINANNPHALRLTTTRSNAGVTAEGYWGIPVETGKTYRYSLYARAEGDLREAVVRLEDAQGKPLAEQRISGIGSDWKTFTGTIKAGGTNRAARLAIRTPSAGTLYLDMVSLFPTDTYKNRANGIRRDLAEKVTALKPAFVRFPGGCYVEGDKLENRFRWKDSIGNIAERPGHWNLWGYRSTDGLGYHEYLQWCEDMGAEPLFVINCGMSHQPDPVPMNQMEPYVQDALDAVEYANGPVTSKWGALRAKHGHPKPFNLKLLQIGNENGGPNYNERYALFHDALKAKYPDLQLVACDWGGIPKNRPLDLIDQHLYATPEVFMRNATRYDDYDRKAPKVYFGEYAVTENAGKGNLRAAIGEAAFLTGLERNCDVVKMASYAPLFVNDNNRAWNPDAIVYDAARSYVTPSYHVQQLFTESRGDTSLPVRLEGATPAVAPPVAPGAVGVGTWRTQAEFKDLRVTDASGKVLYTSTGSLKPSETLPSEFRTPRGKWSVGEEGVLRQTEEVDNVRAIVGDPSWSGDRTYSLKARKLAGAEGFLVLFSVRGGGDGSKGWYWWNVGGWNNTLHGVQNEGGMVGDRVPGKIETGRWYDIRIELRGPRILCYLDNVLVQEVEEKPMVTLAASATRVTKSGDTFVKLVNYSADARETVVDLGTSAPVLEPQGTVQVLTSVSPEDENSLDAPAKVVPVTRPLTGIGANFRYVCPPYSVSVLRLRSKAKR